MNIVHNLLVMFRIADITVPILPHPELIRLRYVKIEPQVLTQYPAGGEGLPPLNKHGNIHQGLNEDMHVIGHDTPRVEMVTLTMEMKK